MIFLDSLRSRANDWRMEAAGWRRRGYESQARVSESYAQDLEELLRELELEELTLKQAAKESGLSYDTLQRKVSSGEIPNAGRKHAPLVRRCDLPHLQLEASPVRLMTGEPDIAEEVLRGRLR